MTEKEFRSEIMICAVGTARALAAISIDPNGIKIEPEQLRKNTSTILTILTETEDFLKDFNQNVCSSSAIIIAED